MILIITLVSFIASYITLFSGFGLGSVLMPVMAIFFPLEFAIALTAFVHLVHNVFKTGIFWLRHFSQLSERKDAVSWFSPFPLTLLKREVKALDHLLIKFYCRGDH